MAVNQRGKNDQSVPRSIRHRCPNGHALKIPSKVAGKKVRCPKEGCGAVFVVPSRKTTVELGPTGRSIETPADSTHVTDSAGRFKIAEVRNTDATERSLFSAIGRIPVWVRITAGVVALAGVFVVGILVGIANNSLPPDELVATDNPAPKPKLSDVEGEWVGSGFHLKVQSNGGCSWSRLLGGGGVMSYAKVHDTEKGLILVTPKDGVFTLQLEDNGNTLKLTDTTNEKRSPLKLRK